MTSDPRRLGPAEAAQRVPFVAAIIALIGAGVGGTLWLSAQSTQETYDLKAARDSNVRLVERKESLETSNERSRSAEVLASRAEKLGLLGVDTAPILSRGADGKVEIVGSPEPKLGAPIQPLQPTPVPSDASKPDETGRFGTPPAQQPQDTAPRGVAPVPYPPVVAAPPLVPAVPVPPPAGQERTADQPSGGAQVTLAPVPGQVH